MFGFFGRKDSRKTTLAEAIGCMGSAMSARHGMSREQAAEVLRTTPEALAAFEDSYRKHEAARGISDNLFQVSAKEMGTLMAGKDTDLDASASLRRRAVNELLAQTETLYWDGGRFVVETFPVPAADPITRGEIDALPEQDRIQLTGHLMRRDMGPEPSYPMLLMAYKNWRDATDPARKKQFYDMFRQGLDILDLDEVTYQIIGTNPNSIGTWLPAIATAAHDEGFFRIPKTRVIKVPLPLLQLAHMEYMELTPATLAVVDEYCRQAFSLEDGADYFVKTGTYSSKFDFRNAHVQEDEVRELGQYLLFIHYQALCRAHYDLSGRNQPVVYGVSTTNEWAVREFIPAASDAAIYHGMPLRPEYRLFVDFDRKEVIGRSPYWEPGTMKHRFERMPDAGEADQVHDSLIYRMAEPHLMAEYHRNVDKVSEHLDAVIQSGGTLSGQWSVDVMQEGDSFYIIDMAVAENSAFYDCVPRELRATREENWLPAPELLALPGSEG